MIRRIRFILFLLVFAPAVSAVTFVEDFESFALGGFNPELTPDQDWYNYAEGEEFFGVVTDTAPIPEGAQAFRMEGDNVNITDLSTRFSSFSLEVPAQITFTSFNITALTPDDNGIGSHQLIQLQSSAPVRTIVEFYVLCSNSTYTDGCDFKVKWQYVDSTGQTLINASLSDSEFFVNITTDWQNSEFCLEVDGVDDGCFPMLDLPINLGRIKMVQTSSFYPMNLTFDNWTVDGAIEGETTGVEGDVATGLKNWMSDVRFNSAGSKFFFGLVLLFVLLAAVIVPLVQLGTDSSILPAVGFYGLLVVLWLVFMEIWPDWIGIALIIAVSSFLGLTLRQVTLGIKDAGSGAGLVVGSLGYFIIASTFLGFSGYAAETVQLPTGQPQQTEDEGNATTAEQSYGAAVAECSLAIVTTAFTLGQNIKGDCSQKTVSKTWEKFEDVVQGIFNWVRTGFDFLFQLLTFQLPIPVVFNMMIVLPPAVGLATYAIGVIRGSGS